MFRVTRFMTCSVSKNKNFCPAVVFTYAIAVSKYWLICMYVIVCLINLKQTRWSLLYYKCDFLQTKSLKRGPFYVWLILLSRIHAICDFYVHEPIFKILFPWKLCSSRPQSYSKLRSELFPSFKRNTIFDAELDYVTFSHWKVLFAFFFNLEAELFVCSDSHQ